VRHIGIIIRLLEVLSSPHMQMLQDRIEMSMHNNASKIMIEHADMTQTELKGFHALKEIKHLGLDPINVNLIKNSIMDLKKQGKKF